MGLVKYVKKSNIQFCIYIVFTMKQICIESHFEYPAS